MAEKLVKNLVRIWPKKGLKLSKIYSRHGKKISRDIFQK